MTTCSRLRGVLLMGVLGCAGPGTGCTLIGLGVGATIDRGPQSRRLPGWSSTGIEEGTPVRLQLADGSHVDGRYRGRVPEPAERYAERYRDARERLASRLRLPLLGARATIETRDGALSEGEFLGVEVDGVRLRQRGQETHVACDDVARLVDAEGSAVSGATLHGLVVAGELPSRRDVALEMPDGQLLCVPADQVAQITFEIPGKTGAKRKGLLIGAAIDVFAALAALLSDPQYILDCGSCAYVSRASGG